MDKSFLRQLYNGEIYPEESIIPKCPEYNQINRVISDQKHYFYKILVEEDRKHFINFNDLRYKWSSLQGY